MLNRTHESCQYENDDKYQSPIENQHSFETKNIHTRIFDKNKKWHGVTENASAPSLVLHSFYRKHGTNIHNHAVKINDLSEVFSTLQPATGFLLINFFKIF